MRREGHHAVTQLVVRQPGQRAEEESDVGDHLLDIAVGGHDHDDRRLGGRGRDGKSLGGGRQTRQ